MFHVLFALLPLAAGRPFPVAVGAKGTLRADVMAPDQPPAVEQKLLRREKQDDGQLFLEEAARVTPSCEDAQTAYAVLGDGSLAVINMGPNTQSGKTEVRQLTAGSSYKDFKQDTPISTMLHITGSEADNGEWTFLADGDDNLVGVNSGITDSNMTEVHRLRYAGTPPWQALDVNVITALPQVSIFDEVEFLLDQASNLVIIKKGPTSSSSMTEINVLSATTGYQTYTMQSATGLALSASTNNNGDWAFLMDGQDNLICIRRPSATDHTVQIKRLTAGSNYHSFDFQNGGVTLPYAPDAAADVHWVFEIDLYDDILAIKEGPTTMQGYTEIHKLNKASNYTSFGMHQEASGAPCRNPYYTSAGGSR